MKVRNSGVIIITCKILLYGRSFCIHLQIMMMVYSCVFKHLQELFFGWVILSFLFEKYYVTGARKKYLLLCIISQKNLHKKLTLSKHPSRHCCIWKVVGVGGGGGNEGGTSSITNPLRDNTSVIKTVCIRNTNIFE